MSDLVCPFCGNKVSVSENSHSIVRGWYMFEHISGQKDSCELVVGILMPDWNEKYEREAIDEYTKRV
jgi:hypothetical protein